MGTVTYKHFVKKSIIRGFGVCTWDVPLLSIGADCPPLADVAAAGRQ